MKVIIAFVVVVVALCMVIAVVLDPSRGNPLCISTGLETTTVTCYDNGTIVGVTPAR